MPVHLSLGLRTTVVALPGHDVATNPGPPEDPPVELTRRSYYDPPDVHLSGDEDLAALDLSGQRCSHMY